MLEILLKKPVRSDVLIEIQTFNCMKTSSMDELSMIQRFQSNTNNQHQYKPTCSCGEEMLR